MSMANALLDAPGKRVLLSTNEAIARGFIEAGLQVAASYPGTPSTEIMETLIRASKKFKLYTEWSVNEKVAAEVAIAGSMAGLRSMVSMKHVGVNVAAEPFMAFTLMGAHGGLVLVSADDVGNYTTHSEQDNRLFARAAYLPVFEPCDPSEAKDMAQAALELSEKWQQPIMLRTTTRLAQTLRDVDLGKVPKRKRVAKFLRDPTRWVDLPQNARRMRTHLIARLEMISVAVNDLKFNRLEGPVADAQKPTAKRSPRTNISQRREYGIITSGITYGYVKEALAFANLNDKINILKIGTPYPIPDKLVKQLLLYSNHILVIEELEPFVEWQIRALANRLRAPNIIHGKDIIPIQGELSTLLVLMALTNFMKIPLKFDLSKVGNTQTRIDKIIPKRLPVLCAGCGYRPVFYAINLIEKQLTKSSKKMKKDKDNIGIIKPSDIGCTTLGFQPPLEAVDTNFCMGASIGISNGFAQTLDNPVICTIGDSTFFHAGIPPLLNAVFNNANVTVIVIDNITTAMTGYQPNPGTGFTATGQPTKRILIEDIAKACGVEYVKVVDPYKLSKLSKLIKKAVEFQGPAVVVARRSCRLLELRELQKQGEKIRIASIDIEKCTLCKKCINDFGCPAMYLDDNTIKIDDTNCNGCGVCAEHEICSSGAIRLD